MRIRYTRPASADLDGVLSDLKARSPQGSRRVAVRIRAVERLLILFPLSGEVTRLPWLRRIKVSSYPYLMFYEIVGDPVVVHAVRHAARAPSSMPDQR